MQEHEQSRDKLQQSTLQAWRQLCWCASTFMNIHDSTCFMNSHVGALFLQPMSALFFWTHYTKPPECIFCAQTLPSSVERLNFEIRKPLRPWQRWPRGVWCVAFLPARSMRKQWRMNQRSWSRSLIRTHDPYWSVGRWPGAGGGLDEH